jgi:phosphatidylglycerophosphate synthase
MPIILSFLDFLVIFVVVISVSRAVWTGPSESSHSLALSIFLALAFIILGIVSLLAASGLTDNSAFNQGALLIFLVATAITACISWVKRPSQ